MGGWGWIEGGMVCHPGKVQSNTYWWVLSTLFGCFFCLLTLAGLLILRFYFLALFTPFYCCCLQISTLQDLMPGFGQNFPKIPLLKYFSQKDTKNQVVTSLIKIPCMISLAVDRSSGSKNHLLFLLFVWTLEAPISYLWFLTKYCVIPCTKYLCSLLLGCKL